MGLTINGTGPVINNSFIQDATLSAASWVGTVAPFTYSLTINGVTSTSNQDLLPSLTISSTQIAALQKANITDAGQSTNTISLKAFGSKPTIDIPIRVVVRKYL